MSQVSKTGRDVFAGAMTTVPLLNTPRQASTSGLPAEYCTVLTPLSEGRIGIGPVVFCVDSGLHVTTPLSILQHAQRFGREINGVGCQI